MEVEAPAPAPAPPKTTKKKQSSLAAACDKPKQGLAPFGGTGFDRKLSSTISELQRDIQSGQSISQGMCSDEEEEMNGTPFNGDMDNPNNQDVPNADNNTSDPTESASCMLLVLTNQAVELLAKISFLTIILIRRWCPTKC